ncbi:hypothetical protein [Streptomyces sp. NRRL S-350]|uniref:hypothetical protein n=1 Tax=Streptomyces sp. NRRL S-350 TaxID=1463902 RepID=UPI0004C1DA0A|nr:hypothetical protein [Streptomyces sp. NRRL S-350]
MSTSGSFTPPTQAACPGPMTAAALRALRDAGGLDPQCHYVLTDFTQGATLAGPNLVELHAVNASTLALEAKVFTPYDNNGWAGLYDIDRGAVGQLIELRDNLNNVVRDSTGTSPILGTFPWGTALWSENEFDSVTLTAPATARVVTGNRVANSTLDMTGWASGNMTASKIENSSVVTTGNVMSITNSHLHGTTVTGAATGSILIQASSRLFSSSVINDPGSLKTVSIGTSDLRGVTLRGQAGTVAASFSVSTSRLRGAAAGGSITSLGDTTVAITRSDIAFGILWTVDGVNGSSVNVTDATIDNIIVTRGPAAGRMDITAGYYTGTTIDHQGSGTIQLSGSWTKSGTLRLAAGSSGSLSLQNGTLENGTMVVTSVRSLSMGVGSYVGGLATVTESGTTAAAIASIGDRLDQSRIEGGAQVTFSTTTGTNANQISRSVVRGSSVAGEGVITITGTTDGAVIDGCDILGGIVTINNASSGLSGQTAFTDNHVDGGSTITYTGGDATAKQVRNNRIEGLSTLTLTGLTGSAGGGVGDVYGMSVRGQSTLTVAGARVAGQPVRDCTVEQGSTLNLPAGGAAQRCRVAGGATVNGGAFVHTDTEVSLVAVKTLTAANAGRLANKSFDDTL